MFTEKKSGSRLETLALTGVKITKYIKESQGIFSYKKYLTQESLKNCGN